MMFSGPDAFKKEAMAIFEQYFVDIPVKEAEDSNLTEEEKDALLHDRPKQWDAYFLKHASPLLREWYIYCTSRCGDEGQLYDHDGTFLIGKNGYPIQRWNISTDHRVVDDAGKQIYYSNGDPILAMKMSAALFDFLKKDGWLNKDATEETMWY